MSWNLNDGLELVRAIQPHCKNYGYHIALGGGVLNAGESEHDLDLYMLPLNNEKKYGPSRPDDLVVFLETLWGKSADIGTNYRPDDDQPFEEMPFRGRAVYGWEVAPPIRALVNEEGVVPLGNPWINPHPKVFKKVNSTYLRSLKFFRNDGTERIDVFIAN